MRRWVIALAVVGCDKTAPPPAAAPPEPEPASRPTLVEAVPAVAEYELVDTPNMPAWLGEGGSVYAWLRISGKCTRLNLDHGPGRTHASIPVCSQRKRRRSISCALKMRTDAVFQCETTECTVHERDGSGVARRVPSAQPPPRLAAVEVSEELVVYAPILRGHIEPGAVDVVEAACSPGSAAKAREAIAAEAAGADEREVAVALRLRYGIIGGQRRRCSHSEGYRLAIVTPGQRGPTRERPVATNVAEPADCSQPCPDDPVGAQALAYTKELRGQTRRVPGRPELVLFRDETTCTAATEDAPPQYVAIDETVCINQ